MCEAQVSPIRVGVLADTHIPGRRSALPIEVFEYFEGVTVILHAGDITEAGVLEELARVAPVHAVRGNMDSLPHLPRQLTVKVGGIRIGLVHEPPRHRTAAGFQAQFGRPVQCVVFGHTHLTLNEVVDGVRLFNPGAVSGGHDGNHIGVIEIADEITARLLPLLE